MIFYTVVVARGFGGLLYFIFPYPNVSILLLQRVIFIYLSNICSYLTSLKLINLVNLVELNRTETR